MSAIKYACVAIILSSVAIMPSAYAVKDGQKFKDWSGECRVVQKEKICGITQMIFNTEKNPVVHIFIRKEKGEKDPIAFVKIPLNVNLQAGLALAVDKEEVVKVPYTSCDIAGCNVIPFSLNKEIIMKMKKGKKLQIGWFIFDKLFIFEGSLLGFSKAINSL